MNRNKAQVKNQQPNGGHRKQSLGCNNNQKEGPKLATKFLKSDLVVE